MEFSCCMYFYRHSQLLNPVEKTEVSQTINSHLYLNDRAGCLSDGKARLEFCSHRCINNVFASGLCIASYN
jgi:ACT domain-containing protein